LYIWPRKPVAVSNGHRTGQLTARVFSSRRRADDATVDA
jgi:hypothetical protein